jgi:YidC/Oxa1 family membrane protein insertase
MDRNTQLAILLSIGVILIYSMLRSPLPPVDPAFVGAEQAEETLDAESSPDAAGRHAPRARMAEAKAEPEAGFRDARAPEEFPLWEGSFSGDDYVARLTNRGAALSGWTLQKFEGDVPESAEREKIELVTAGPDGAVARTSFPKLGLADLVDAHYRVESASNDRAVFVLERDGLSIRKIYEFDFEQYRFELTIEVHNGSNRSVAPEFAIEWPVQEAEGNDYKEQSLLGLHGEDVERELVASVGSPGFFGRLFGGNGDQPEVWSNVQWAGSDIKYFVSLLIPKETAGTELAFEPLEKGVRAATILRIDVPILGPGESFERSLTGFLGPKQPSLLSSFDRDLTRTINLGYSWIEPLTLFFHWLLASCYGFVPNYGLSIILITILVRVVTLPIMNRQMRSMEKMRALQPQMKAIQAEHANDRQKQSEATMALYKETGVNPLGGCLPMLLQFPVFIGLFFALQSSFDLRQAPFVGWISDLSAPEALFTIPGIGIPFRVLPVVMGASMILQQRLTPTTVDPSQQMMMMVLMPVMMTVLFYQFPSGLVLYWMTSNFLGIAHQLLVGRRMKAAAAAA